ncbi:MAG: siphovirus Gp157 family protein [Chloroflexota bacterium]|nr:siphovirus Gp157 family protein [Chloroflexota bacterium]
MTTALTIYELPEGIAGLADAECTECEGRNTVTADNGAEQPCPACCGDMFLALEPRLRELKLGAEKAVLGLGRLWKELDAEAAMLELHAKAIADRAAARRRRIEALKRWLLLELDAAGVQKVKDAEVTVYTQKNPASLDVVDEALVPARYKRAHIEMPLADVPVEWVPYIKRTDVMKSAMNDELRADGVIPPGCEVRNGYHVRVR